MGTTRTRGASRAARSMTRSAARDARAARLSLRRCASAALAALACVGSAHSAEKAAPPITVAPAFARDALVVPPRRDWATNGGNCLNQRYSPLAGSTAATSRAQGVWRTQLAARASAPQYSGEAQPIVYDGAIYVVDRRRRRVRRRRRQRRDPLVVRGEPRPERRRRAAAAGRAAASRSARARSSSGQLDGKLVALDQRPARSSGRSKPSAGRRASRSRARRSTTTGS